MTLPSFEGIASRWFVAACAVVALALFASLVVMRGLYGKLREPLSWPAVHARIAKEFPGVRQTPSAVLAAKLADPEPARPLPLLVDCRSPGEFAVSHLPGARNLRSVEEIARHAGHDREIVAYCSVGLRSSALARDLAAAGFTDVSNLEGSIFGWANERRALVAPDGTTTTEVHPFNARWGTLLDERAD